MEYFLKKLLISDSPPQAIAHITALSFIYKYFANQFEILLENGQNCVIFCCGMLNKILIISSTFIV